MERLPPAAGSPSTWCRSRGPSTSSAPAGPAASSSWMERSGASTSGVSGCYSYFQVVCTISAEPNVPEKFHDVRAGGGGGGGAGEAAGGLEERGGGGAGGPALQMEHRWGGGSSTMLAVSGTVMALLLGGGEAARGRLEQGVDALAGHVRQVTCHLTQLTMSDR